MKNNGNFGKFFGSDDKSTENEPTEKKVEPSSENECQRDLALWADTIIKRSLEAEKSSEKRERAMRKNKFLFPFFIGAIASFIISTIVYFVFF